jgi:UDPglucose 6-dehydrogenase
MESRVQTVNPRKVVVVGCGKLGTPLVACLANAGHTVTGIDVNQGLINNLQSGIVSWNEPGLTELLASNSSRISFHSSYDRAFEDAEITFVIVPTPSTPTGEFSNEYVIDAVSRVGLELSKRGPRDHLVVIVSTVMPGSTQGVIKEKLLESASTSAHLIQICYSPEFIALGTVIKNMQFPDLVLIGQENETSGQILEEISLSVVKNNPQVSRLTIAEAEISKIAINSFVTTKISFSNQISEICEATPETSAVKVLEAIGNDSRIGRSYLAPGAGYGGPCFPRDNRAFNTYANTLGLTADLAIATDLVNARQNSRVLKLVTELVAPGSRILVVGLSYKPDTDVIEESPGVAFLYEALNAGFQVDAVDEYVKAHQLESKFTVTIPTMLQMVDYDAAILFVPAHSYSHIPDVLNMNTKLIDLWGLWINSQQESYLRLGNSRAGN